MSPRIIFQISTRRGLGHFMRGMNIAKEIFASTPTAKILFVTRGSIPHGFVDSRIEFFASPDEIDCEQYRKLVVSFKPDAIVFDTMLPSADIVEQLDAVKTVYVMRKCETDRQREILESAFLTAVDRVVVPHEESDFPSDVPDELAVKTFFVGTIVRRPEPETTMRLRNKYELHEDSFVLVSTPGGGGYENDANLFFDIAGAADLKIRKTIPDLQHLAFAGPRCRGSATVRGSGIRFLDAEPDLVSLFPLCNLVISAAGYNTVNELRATKTPTVFLPGNRKYDDQFERVKHLEETELAKVFTGIDESEIADGIAELCSDQAGLQRMRDKYRDDDFVIGNTKAAERILSLIEP